MGGKERDVSKDVFLLGFVVFKRSLYNFSATRIVFCE